VTWTVLLHEEFESELQSFDAALQDELLAHAKLLQEFGPRLGRPTVDALNGSAYGNMKELRFGWHGGVWRVPFAFDPRRQAILLVAGNKAGIDEKRFYKRLIAIADARFKSYLSAISTERRSQPKRNYRAKKS
jgi:hypothetical protein